jgi:hypothetical protein
MFPSLHPGKCSWVVEKHIQFIVCLEHAQYDDIVCKGYYAMETVRNERNLRANLNMARFHLPYE